MPNTPKKSSGKLAGALGARGGNGGGNKGGAGGHGQPPKKEDPQECDNPVCPLMWHNGVEEWEIKITCPTCQGVGKVTHMDCNKCYTNRKTIASGGKEDCTYCNMGRKRPLTHPGDCETCEKGTKDVKRRGHCPGSGKTR